MRSKKQTVFSKNMHQETNLDRPGHFDRGGPFFPMKQYHHMRCGYIFTHLVNVEREIAEKLLKLKMECFGNDKMNAKTQTVLSGTYEDEKPVSMYYLAIQEKSIYFEIPESPEAFRKLWKEELEIIQKLQKLKLNQVKLEHKKKLFYLPSYTHYQSNTRRKIEWKVEEIEELKQSFRELYVSKQPRQRNDSNISPLHDEQIVKLHNGRHNGSKNLVEERKLLKKINQAREEVEKISANSLSEPVTRIYTQGGDILDTKEALANYIKVTSREVEELRMKQMRYRAYDGRAELEKAATVKEITILERKLDIINHKKSKLASKLLIKYER